MYYTVLVVVRNGVGNRAFCCALCTSRRVYRMYLAVTLSAQIHPSILYCSSNILCFTANSARRRAAGQLGAQKNARYNDSYMRAFDPARLLHSNRGSSGTCRRASLTSFRGYDPDVTNSAGDDGLPPRDPLKLRRWLEDNTRAIAASATKKRLNLSLLPTTWTLDLCPTNSRVLLRRRRCSSPKAVPSCVSIA